MVARSAVRRRPARVSEAVSPANIATFPIGSIVVQMVAKSLLILIRRGDMCRKCAFILIQTADQARDKQCAVRSGLVHSPGGKFLPLKRFNPFNASRGVSPPN